MTDELIPIKHTRRAYSTAIKAEKVVASQQPGVSVAGLALAHGLNTNLLRRWIRQYEHASSSNYTNRVKAISRNMPSASCMKPKLSLRI